MWFNTCKLFSAVAGPLKALNNYQSFCFFGLNIFSGFVALLWIFLIIFIFLLAF